MERDVRDLLDFYRAPPPKPHPARGVLEISDSQGILFDGLASLIDLPDDGRLFHCSRFVVELLIDSWMKYSPGARDSVIMEQIGVLYTAAKQLSQKETLQGVKRSNPVYAFLLTFSASGRIEPRHRRLIPYLLRRIRRCHQRVDSPTPEYLYHLCLVARKILVAAPFLAKTDDLEPDARSLLMLAKTTEKYSIDGVQLISSGDKTYLRDLLLRDRKHLGHSHGGGEGERQPRWNLLGRGRGVVQRVSLEILEEIADPALGFLPDERPVDFFFKLSESAPESAEMALTGEEESDYLESRSYLVPARWFENPWIAKRQQRGMQEGFAMQSRIQPWDRRCLSLRSIKHLMSMLDCQENEPALGAIGMALLCGMSDRLLRKIHVLSLDADFRDESDEAVERLVASERFYDPKERTLWWMNPRGPESDPSYRPVPEFLRLALPEIIVRHLPKSLKVGDALFDGSHLRNARATLKRLTGNEGVRAAFSQLVSTFEAYFIGFAGLPELWADMVQGKSRAYLRSQHYYITLDWGRFCRRWRTLVERMVREAGSPSAKMFKQIRQDETEGWHSGNFAGATGTPEAGMLREVVRKLLSSFPREKKHLLEASKRDPQVWNMYQAYLYLLMVLTTGRRPQRDPFPSLDMFDLESGQVFIADKFNRVFREARVIPLCPTLREAIAQYRTVHNEAYCNFVLRGFSSNVGSRMPFVVDDQDRELLPVSPRNLERVSVSPWPGMKNGPRHFLLSRLHEVGVPQEAIDFLSGHRHEQREPEMSASPVSWAFLAPKLAEIIEAEVVRPLGLEVPFGR